MSVSTASCRPRGTSPPQHPARRRGPSVARHASACVAALLWLLPAGAAAQSVEEATELFYAAEFQAAGASFEQVLASSSLAVADAAEAHRFLAAIRSLEGRQDVAAEHAEAAVLLDPTATAPAGASRLGTLFDAARSRTHGTRARMRLDVEDTDGARIVSAELSPAAIVLVSRTRIECVRPDAVSRDVERPGPAVELELDAAFAVDGTTCTATGLTSGGAALFSARRVLGAGGDESFPWEWVAIGAGGAAAALGIVLVAVLVSSSSPSVEVGGIAVTGW